MRVLCLAAAFLVTVSVSLPSFALNNCRLALEGVSHLTDSEKTDSLTLKENFANLLIFETPLFNLEHYVDYEVKSALERKLGHKYPRANVSKLAKLYETELSPQQQNEVAKDIWAQFLKDWKRIPTTLDGVSMSDIRWLSDKAETNKVAGPAELTHLRNLIEKIDADPKLRIAAINMIRYSLPVAVKRSRLISKVWGEERNRRAVYETISDKDLTDIPVADKLAVVPQTIAVALKESAIKVEYNLTEFSTVIQRVLEKPEFSSEEGFFALLTSEQYPILFGEGYFNAFLDALGKVNVESFSKDYSNYSPATLHEFAEKLWAGLGTQFRVERLNVPKLQFSSEANAFPRFSLSTQTFIQSGLMIKAIEENPELKAKVIQVIQGRLKASGELASDYKKAAMEIDHVDSAFKTGLLSFGAPLLTVFASSVVSSTGHHHLGQIIAEGGLATAFTPMIVGPVTYLAGKWKDPRRLPKFKEKIKNMKAQLSKGDAPKKSEEEE